MLRLSYGSEDEREKIFQENTANGLLLVEEQNHFNGNFLIFKEADIPALDVTNLINLLVDKGIVTREEISKPISAKAIAATV